MGKRKVISEDELERMVLPSANDVLGMAVRMLGFDRIVVKCQDGKERLCRVRGKLKRRVWIRDGDIVLVSPMGVSVGQTRRHFLAIQKKPDRMAKKPWLPYNVEEKRGETA